MPFESGRENTSEATRWRRIRRKVIQRVIAVAVGMVLWILLAFLPLAFLVKVEWHWFAAHIVSYTLGGVILGFLWPDGGWRLGPYLFASWAAMLVFIFVITDPPSVIDWKGELLRLFGLLMILPGACLGGWIGSILRRRFSSDVSHDNQHTLPSS
jgi:hypothetical protein